MSRFNSNIIIPVTAWQSLFRDHRSPRTDPSRREAGICPSAVGDLHSAGRRLLTRSRSAGVGGPIGYWEFGIWNVIGLVAVDLRPTHGKKA